MMDVNDIARRALTRPQIYVPALVDEIVRLRQELQELKDSQKPVAQSQSGLNNSGGLP